MLQFGTQFSILKLNINVFFLYGSKKLFEIGGCTVQKNLVGQKRWDFSLRHQTRCATHQPRIQRGFCRGLARTLTMTTDIQSIMCEE